MLGFDWHLNDFRMTSKEFYYQTGLLIGRYTLAEE